MEYYLPRRRIFFFITSPTILLMVLFIEHLAAEPMWIWTKGCFRLKDEDTPKDCNKSDNLPHTCFETCGPHSTVVALQGNKCRCGPKSKPILARGHCATCERNSMVTCGNPERSFWSLYEKAKIQELTEYNIPTNATGCIVNTNGLYRVENCSKTGIKSFCKNALSSSTDCKREEKWSTRSCNNAFDNIVTNFVDKPSEQSCKDYWIGLFAIDEHLSHSTLSSYPQWPPSSSFPAESSVLLASAESSVLLASAESSVLLASAEPSVLLASAESSVLLASAESTDFRETPPSKSLSVLPTKPSQFETSSESLSYLYSSFSESLPPYVDPFVITETLPVLSQSELHFSMTLSDSVSNRISFSSKTHISPTRTKSELSNNEYSSASVLFTSVILSRSGSIRRSPEPSFRLSMLSSSLKNEMDGTSTTAISASTTIDGISTTAVSASTTVMLATRHISPTPSYNTQKYSSETDLKIAVYVLGAIAAISLASTGVVYIYMKRSQTNLMKMYNRTTTYTGDPPETDEELGTNNTYSDLLETSFCPRGIRANFGGNDNRPCHLFNGRTAIENDYVLY